MNNPAEKRITMKLKHPNPLFENWLTEWRDSAKEHDSKTQYAFSKALQSLRKYPLPLQTGKDCKILQGFGDKLCQMLDKKLQEYKSGGGDPEQHPELLDERLTPEPKPKPKKIPPKSDSSSPDAKKKKKEYTPAYRSGGYAILVTLYKNSLRPDFLGFTTKDDLIKQAQCLCEKSFVKPDPGTFYTSWSSMRTLIDKNLVEKRGQPAKYLLTDEGLIAAHRLYRTSLTDEVENNQVDSQNYNKFEEDVVEVVVSDSESDKVIRNEPSSQSSAASSSLGAEDETVVLAPNTFHVFLAVDNKETAGSSKDVNEDAILAELTYRKVQFEVRHLKVGDYVWLCRDRASQLELVLPYVVERKRMDDFGSSIKDGRYHEQKFRLKQCGMQNVTYLVESYGDNTHTGLPLATLMQAATNTLVHDDFQLKFTSDVKETALYLCCMTKLLQNIFTKKTVMSCRKVNLEACGVEDDLVPLLTFKEFNQIGSMHKKFTARQLFIRQLIQLKGLSVEKALAIVDKFPCPRLLKQAFEESAGDKSEKLLATVKFGKNNKNIGPVISRTLHQLYKVEDDLVPSLTFKEFNQIGSVHKKFTACQLFIRELKGLSVEKALAIADKFPAPNY